MRDGTRAWVLIGGSVILYEITSKEGELLSEAVDGYLERYPVATTFAIVLTSMHLLNVLPERVDPWVVGLKAVKSSRSGQMFRVMRASSRRAPVAGFAHSIGSLPDGGGRHASGVGC